VSSIRINLQQPRAGGVLRSSERIVASPDGNHFFTFRPDWTGPVPLPFRAAAATVGLLDCPDPPRILILGFGLGAMGSMMKEWREDCLIVGVEPSRKLYRAATGALSEDVVLHRADAVSFLRRSDQMFDLILDDCFIVVTDQAGDSIPYRPAKLEVLPELAKARLAPEGVYVRNLLDQDDLDLAHHKKRILENFCFGHDRTFREWDNVLTVASDRKLSGTAIARLGNEA